MVLDLLSPSYTSSSCFLSKYRFSSSGHDFLNYFTLYRAYISILTQSSTGSSEIHERLLDLSELSSSIQDCRYLTNNRQQTNNSPRPDRFGSVELAPRLLSFFPSFLVCSTQATTTGHASGLATSTKLAGSPAKGAFLISHQVLIFVYLFHHVSDLIFRPELVF